MRFLSFHINNIPQMSNGKEIGKILTFSFIAMVLVSIKVPYQYSVISANMLSKSVRF